MQSVYMWLLSAGFSVMQVIVALLSLVGALMLMSGCEFTVTGRRQLQTTIQAIDLATLTSPYAGTTVGQPDAYTPSCSSSYASDMVFFYDLPAGSTIEIGQTSNSFDSVHELSWGGTAPGTNIVTCTDDPDTSRSTWTNTESSTQRVFFVVDAYSSGGSGTFTISWTVTPPPTPTPNPTATPTPPPVAVTMTLPGDVAAITSSVTVKAAFEAAFATDIATHLGLGSTASTYT
jgi:hypothetical protein